MPLYDAIIVPGGGLEPGTSFPNPWVRARLDAALKLSSSTRFFVVLSRGTTHRPPPLDGNGFPITEAAASAKYLLENGISQPERILLESWSFDTIGNAFFARAMICEPLRLKQLCVITSQFHMPRTQAIFEWIFKLDGWSPSIDYQNVQNVGLSDAQTAARLQKERNSLDRLVTVTVPQYDSMKKLALFVFQNHAAYNTNSVGRFESNAPEFDNRDNGVDHVNSTY